MNERPAFPLFATLAVAAVALAACGGAHAASPVVPLGQGAAAAAATHRSGGGNGSGSATITIDASSPGAAVSTDVLGANMAVWYDITQSGLSKEFTQAGMREVRWPGGSASDEYHWQTQAFCNGGYGNSNSSFDNFMQDVVKPAKLDVSITLNYGSNSACNAGGDPNEAAAWVKYANTTQHYGVKHWTVGNEVYGSWEYDLHSPAHDAATYANAVATGFYPAIKAVDKTAQVGVVLEPGWSPAWDPTVISKAKFDFVELHYYAQTPGQESDTYLTQQAPQAFASFVASAQSELSAAGVNVPIFVGEMGSVYSNPGKQTTSITQALYAGQVVADMMQLGVARATWWLGNGGCSDASSGNFSNSLYGWQAFGGYMVFSDGLPEYGCPNAPSLTRGVLLPTARAYQVLSAFARNGEHMLPATVPQSLPLVRAYGTTYNGGYAVLLFNLDQTNSATVTVDIAHAAKNTFAGTSKTYDKQIYDASKNNKWDPPATKQLGSVGSTFTATLPPWSIAAYVLR